MATKKQKRQALIAKHEQEMEEYRQTGLRAQQKDREYRAHKEREEWRKNHEKRHSWQKRIKECPLCNDEIKAAKKAAPIEARVVVVEAKNEDRNWENHQDAMEAEFDASIGGVEEMELSEKADA